MNESAMLPLSSWESFYVIVGSSAAALTGLMFVVITLVASVPRPRSSRTIGAYATPTVVHFCAALAISATLSAPWESVMGPSWVLAAIGVFGVVYVAIVTYRARQQTEYKPVFEDWLWHTLLPLLVYITVIVAAVFLHIRPTAPLFEIGACVLLLLFIGIHNSWDTVTYLALDPGYTQPTNSPDSNGSAAPQQDAREVAATGASGE